MTKAAEFRQKADEYEALAVQTKAGDLRQHYEAMAREYRTLAEGYEKFEPKKSEQSELELERLAERVLGKTANKA